MLSEHFQITCQDLHFPVSSKAREVEILRSTLATTRHINILSEHG